LEITSGEKTWEAVLIAARKSILKMTDQADSLIPMERIQQCIYLVRRQKIMLDSDLARLYGVETKALVRAVKRNIRRFPGDFMFQLTKGEYETFLRCQIGTSKTGSGGRRYLPYAFTEQGVAMLSSVLTSQRAIEVNIAIVRTFVKLREILVDNASLRQKIEALERKYDEQFQQVFEVLNLMSKEEEEPREPFGFRRAKKN
jgi:phage regulator Rha-like protein